MRSALSKAGLVTSISSILLCRMAQTNHHWLDFAPQLAPLLQYFGTSHTPQAEVIDNTSLSQGVAELPTKLLDINPMVASAHKYFPKAIEFTFVNISCTSGIASLELSHFSLLTRLSLESCRLFDDDIATLCSQVLNPSGRAGLSQLEYLNLKSNYIFSKGARTLASTLRSKTMPLLHTIILSQNWISDGGCLSLISAVKHVSTLESTKRQIWLDLTAARVRDEILKQAVEDSKLRITVSNSSQYSYNDMNDSMYTGTFIYEYCMTVLDPPVPSRCPKLTGMLLEYYTDDNKMCGLYWLFTAKSSSNLDLTVLELLKMVLKLPTDSWRLNKS